MQLFGEVLATVDDLHVSGRHSRKGHCPRQDEPFGAGDLVSAGDDVEPNGGELPTGQSDLDGEAPARTPRFVDLQQRRRPDREGEAVVVRIGRQRLDQQVADFFGVGELAPQRKVEVAGGTGSVMEPELDGHPTLQDPPSGRGRLQADEEPLDDGASPKPLEVHAGLRRLVPEAIFQGGP